ncbi:MAG: hypothetical protein AAF346_02920 [Pseudomonadota bacterium]
MPLIASCGFDETELALLDGIRHICCGYSVEDYDGGRAAWERLCQTWSPADSAKTLTAIQEFLSALRKSRSNPFEFIGPFCPHCSRRICKSELEMMLLLREARSEVPARTLMAAQYLVGKGDPKAVVVAAVDIANTVAGANRAIASASRELGMVH